jgi:hypothetical protein
MLMLKLRHYIKISIFPMSVLLPLWLTFGRGLLGSGGWGMLIYLFIYAPVLLLLLLLIGMFINSRPEVKTTGMVSDMEAVLLLALYLSVFLHGFFVVDGGDTQDSINSVAMSVFGKSFQGQSEYYSGIFLSSAMVLLITVFVLALFNKATRRAAAA